jgi:hypothetical protein
MKLKIFWIFLQVLFHLCVLGFVWPLISYPDTLIVLGAVVMIALEVIFVLPNLVEQIKNLFNKTTI